MQMLKTNMSSIFPSNSSWRNVQQNIHKSNISRTIPLKVQAPRPILFVYVVNNVLMPKHCAMQLHFVEKRTYIMMTASLLWNSGIFFFFGTQKAKNKRIHKYDVNSIYLVTHWTCNQRCYYIKKEKSQPHKGLFFFCYFFSR